MDRTLLDRRLSISGELRGRAEFTAVGGALLYCERGRLSFGTHEGPAEQQFSYEFPNGNGRAFVQFRDGREFHDFDLLQGQDVVSHACNRDIYEGHFVALDQQRWRSTWTVVGPRKDQEIRTLYTRLAPA